MRPCTVLCKVKAQDPEFHHEGFQDGGIKPGSGFF
jgi:hypothetical protein